MEHGVFGIVPYLILLLNIHFNKTQKKEFYLIIYSEAISSYLMVP